MEPRWEVAMLERLRLYVSLEQKALVIAALTFLFCAAIILGFM